MAKRFIDTGLFDDNWFMDLSKDGKLLYLYIITKCSHAGLIEINERLCKFQTGVSDVKAAMKDLGNRLISVKEGFFFAPKFLFFQYPNFPNSKVFQQKTALEELTKLGLFKDGQLTLQEGFSNPYDNDSDNVDDNDSANVSEKKEIIFPFDSVEFMKWWGYWKVYKSDEHGFKYKSEVSEQAALKKLAELADAIESDAIKIIEQSIANGWKGFFRADKVAQSSSDMDEYKRKLKERIGDGH